MDGASGAIRRVTTYRRLWRAWAGSPVELRKAADLLQSYVDDRRSGLLREFDDETDSLRLQMGSGVHSEPFEIERTVARRAIEEMRLTMEIIAGPTETSGPVDEVFPEFDRRSYRRIRLSIDSRGQDRLTLTFEPREPFHRGISLEIRSIDRGWANQVMAGISAELDLGKPHWAALYSPGGEIIGGALAVIVISVGLQFAFGDWMQGTWQRLILLGLSLPFIVYIAIVIPIRRRVFPPIEITAEGERPTGTKTILAAIGLLATIPVGILINVLTR